MASSGKIFRHDVEGLRGLAIALVVVFHVFVGRVSAGVDVFLLLGGVFFFGSQLANARNPKGTTLIQSIIRILRRLFPLLAVVVGATLLAGLLMMNRLMHRTLAEDAGAALGYFINWQLAFSGRDYAAAQATVSPFQHLWSMSAQLQIYLGSLVIVVLLALIFRKFSKVALWIALVGGTLASFIFATHLHQTDQAQNYYSTFSRFWEIGLGGILGLLLLPRKQREGEAKKPLVPSLPAWLRWPMGIIGLSMIISTGWVVDGASTFPGPWTLLPLSGATLVLLAGQGEKPVGVTWLLQTKPLRTLGRISYALYLWHWPLMIILVSTKNVNPHKPFTGISIIVVSLGLAWLSNRFIEKPLRQGKRPERSFVVTSPSYMWRHLKVWPKTVYAAVIIAIAGSVFMAPQWIQQSHAMDARQQWDVESDRSLYPGALEFTDGYQPPANIPLTPPLDEFDDLLPPTQPDGCQIGFDSDDLVLKENYNESDNPCVYGDKDSKKTLYVIGGSHSEHYMPALDLVGKRYKVQIKPLLKMGCPVNSTVPKFDGSPYPSCKTWSKKVTDYIKKNPPTEGVFMTGTRPQEISGAGMENVPKEYVDLVKNFTDEGIHTWLMRDNPWFMTDDRFPAYEPKNVRQCVAEMAEGQFNSTDEAKSFPGFANPSAPTAEEIAEVNDTCGMTTEQSLMPVNPSIKAYKGLDVTQLDLSGFVCPDNYCPAIMGNVVAYRDAHHFTNVFSETLNAEIGRQMFPHTKQPPLVPRDDRKFDPTSLKK